MHRPRIFLLSPANTGGERAKMALNERAQFDLAVKLRSGGAPIGEVYSFISGLYFRGKLAYATAFGSAAEHGPGALVITPGLGLIPVETVVSIDQLKVIAGIPVDVGEPRYLAPLERDARLLADADCDFVLLGSVATAKYVEPLLAIFGNRLLFPCDFVGRGDMSRGGLMLRCARDGVELSYVPIRGAILRGVRPPKLPKLKR